MPKLTKRAVEAIKPDPNSETLAWDSEIPGFGVRVWPSGKRTYILKYRTRDGRQRKLTIGRHGPTTAEQARNSALHMLSEARHGEDPAEQKNSARRAPTVQELTNRYIAEHAKTKKRASSVRSDEALLRLHILPSLGNAKVASVKPQLVAEAGVEAFAASVLPR